MIVKVLDIPKTLPNIKLPSHISEHCNLYKEPKSRHSSIYAWMVLSNYIDLSTVKFNKNGKPYSTTKDVYFSLSHSLNKIAIVVCNKPVGIDIEVLIPNTIVKLLSKKILTKRSHANFNKSSNKQIWFTKYWTTHEAYIKLLGKSINYKNLSYPIKDKVVCNRIYDNDTQYFVSIIIKK